MQLTHLSLTNFRNFSRLDMDMPGGTLLLVGANAQGKTSLLEAVYFLATLTSFHASSDRQLINFLEGRNPLAVARIVADFTRRSGDHHLEVRIIQENESGNGPRVRKEVLLDGVRRKNSEVIGQFNAVMFLPQMLAVVDGAPEERRRYLNLALAQVVAHYPDALADYTRALTQRNALLKQLFERQGDLAQLDFWDEQLSAFGAQIIHARILAVQELERLAARVHLALTHSEEVLRLNYLPAFDPLNPSNGKSNGKYNGIRESARQLGMGLDTPVDRSACTPEMIRRGFIQALTGLRSEEVARGVTTIGPHRDELRFQANGVDLGVYGSRGQVRTAMLALKIAEMMWMKDKSGDWPVLLLDEVLAELDTTRRHDLLERLTQAEQTLLTTTDLDLFADTFVQRANLWELQNGRITQPGL